VVCGAELLRTARPDALSCGLAQVRRRVETQTLALLHLVFAPAPPRPLLLGLVRLENRSEELLELRYSELWDLPGREIRADEGACLCDTDDGARALADAGAVIRGRAPQPLPTRGLALDLELALPPGARRELQFAYAAPEPGEDPAGLVRAWRGDVAAELVRTASLWSTRLAGAPNSVEAYRVEVSR
jgi:hypothetical protein